MDAQCDTYSLILLLLLVDNWCFLVGLTANDAFLPLLEANRTEIESVRRETFQYGKTERHKLDVYYPSGPKPTPVHKPPILFYSYLGGLEVGDRLLPETNDLVYKNIGAFFALRAGFLTIVADYRLVPAHAGSAKYPDCLYDVRDALEFITSGRVAEIDEYGDRERIFLLGHSAGAMNQSSFLLNPAILPISHPLRQRIKGAIWNGGCYHFIHNVHHGMPIEEYFGPSEKKGHVFFSSFGLLESTSNEVIKMLPPMLLISAEWETEGLFRMAEDFTRVLKERLGEVGRSTPGEGGGVLGEWRNMGHNHISSYLSLMSGEGEEWGWEVIRWVRARL